MIVPIHNHSQFSALDGFSTIPEIVERAKEIGCPCCGLTDHAVISGHLEFYKAMTEAGIKPILGCEMYHGVNFGNVKGSKRDQAHLILLARTDEGLKNLWRLIDWTAVDDERFHHVGRVNWDALERHSEGVSATSACGLGLVPQGLLKGDTEPLNRYLSIYGDNFHLELSTYPHWIDFNDTDLDGSPINTQVQNEALVHFGEERGIPFVIGDDAHKARKNQFEAHNAYLALYGRQTTWTPVEERKMFHPPEALYMHDESEVREALSYLPDHVVDEAIANTVKLGESVDAKPPAAGSHMPVFFPKECPWLENDERDATEVFIDLVEQGIISRYGNDAPDEVWDRAVYEMEALIDDGIDHYFLWGWDEIQFAKSESIEVGPGRGSSAGSIVAYALGITDVCPLHYGLIFERFWNKGRAKGFPDIDTDFEIRSRRQMREYLEGRLGKDRVRPIGTIGRMMPKAVLDRIGKAAGLEYTEIEALKEIVVKNTPKIEILGYKQIGWSREYEPGKRYYVEDHCLDLFLDYIDSQPKARQDIIANALELCRECCNRISQYGVHASGIVVSNIDLPDYAPCYLRGKKEDRVAATMFAMDDIEKLGLNKLDVLGLRTLDTLAEWKNQMADKGINIVWSGLDREEYPQEMWDMLAEEYVAGIFQLEKNLGRRLCKEFKPSSIEELAICGALIRPGPNKFIDSFIIRRNGGTDDEFDGRTVPILKDILDPTYGWFLYQEQVIAFFNKMNYTLGESDAVRKILGKKLPVDMEKLKVGEGEWEGRGYFEMAEAAGIGKEAAEILWDMLESFAEYSFNKSHAICYAVLGFRCLFAKYYGAPEFYISCIRTVEGEKRKEMLPLYINEARRLKIDVLPPDIRYSMGPISTVDGRIYFGFNDVKEVKSGGEHIVEWRENDMNMDTPDEFRMALEDLNENFAYQKKMAAKDGDPWPKTAKSPKQKFGSGKIRALEEVGAWDGLVDREISLSEKQKLEEQYLEVILSDNSVEVLANNAEQTEDCDEYAEVTRPWAEKEPEYDWEDIAESKRSLEYVVCGTITGIRETKTRAKGESMAFVTIEHEGKELEFTVFHRQWISYKKFLFKLRNVGIFTIRHTAKGHNFEEGTLLS